MVRGEREFVVAVLPRESVVTFVAYRPQDQVDLLAEHFSGCEARILDAGLFGEYVHAEVRALLELAQPDGRDGVVIGRTDGEGGWASWGLRFFAPKPEPIPKLNVGFRGQLIRDLKPAQILAFADAADLATRRHLLQATVILLDSAGRFELADGTVRGMLQQIHAHTERLLAEQDRAS